MSCDGQKCKFNASPQKTFKTTFTKTKMAFLTLTPKILCTGSESSKTTKPKLGIFPPVPLVLIRNSTTFPNACWERQRTIKCEDD